MCSFYLIKVGDNFIEQSQTLDALIISVQLNVKLHKVGYGGEADAHSVVRLMVEILFFVVKNSKILFKLGLEIYHRNSYHVVAKLIVKKVSRHM